MSSDASCSTSPDRTGTLSCSIYRAASRSCQLLTYPVELLRIIGAYLDDYSLTFLTCTCHRFGNIFQPLWLGRYINQFALDEGAENDWLAWFCGQSVDQDWKDLGDRKFRDEIGQLL